MVWTQGYQLFVSLIILGEGRFNYLSSSQSSELSEESLSDDGIYASGQVVEMSVTNNSRSL